MAAKKKGKRTKKNNVRRENRPITNLVVVSDLHVGCQLGLCPKEGALLDEGGLYLPNAAQQTVWDWWKEFWNDWVPAVCRGEPFAFFDPILLRQARWWSCCRAQQVSALKIQLSV